MQKLYAYVDETGQDTHGVFFLVAVVIAEEDREQLQAALEQIDQQSQKGRLKWRKASFERRIEYLRAVLSTPLVRGKIFFGRYAGTRAYLDLTIYTTAKAILKRAEGTYRAVVWVDGLDKQEARRFEKKKKPRCDSELFLPLQQGRNLFLRRTPAIRSVFGCLCDKYIPFRWACQEQRTRRRLGKP